MTAKKKAKKKSAKKKATKKKAGKRPRKSSAGKAAKKAPKKKSATTRPKKPAKAAHQTSADPTLVRDELATPPPDVSAEPHRLSDLAVRIYGVLRALVPSPYADITYSGLINELGMLPPPNQQLMPHDVRLDEALEQLTVACRNNGLPLISALVVRTDSHIPGAGYFHLAHPDVRRDKALGMIAWGQEIEHVRVTRYPEEL